MPLSQRTNRWITIAIIICAGEAIFSIPYHITRFFRPTFLEVFELSATELGVAQGAYGIVAVGAYFFGGPLADRFQARTLLSTSMWITSLGGLYLATFPNMLGVTLVYGFFGLTTVLLFWAALIKVTRSWGGADSPGLAYGLLDGGRGLLAALLGSVAVFIFSLSFPLGYDAATLTDKRTVLTQVIYGYTTVTALTGLAVWFALKGLSDTSTSNHNAVFGQIRNVIRMPIVWVHSTIVVCAYTSYLAFDQYALFAVRGHGIDPIDAAQLVTIGAWTRPIAALVLGLIGDRFGISRMTFICFIMLIGSHSFFAFTGESMGLFSIITMNTLVTGIAIFGLRGLYFALLQEGQIPMSITGTTVGLVSVIGFLPDIYVAALAGYLIDRTPGLGGFQDLFLVLLIFSIIGAGATMMFRMTANKTKKI